MTVIARFEIIPVREGSMSTAIANALQALDRYPVSYRTTPTDTVIEADTVDQVFEAVSAAHKAIPDDRVITNLEVDEDRRRPQHMDERVASVEHALGHPPERGRPRPASEGAVGQAVSPPPQSAPPVGEGPTATEQPTGNTGREPARPGPPGRET